MNDECPYGHMCAYAVVCKFPPPVALDPKRPLHVPDCFTPRNCLEYHGFWLAIHFNEEERHYWGMVMHPELTVHPILTGETVDELETSFRRVADILYKFAGLGDIDPKKEGP